MAQLSPITLVYDQIAVSIAAIVKKQSEGKYVTKQDVLQEFHNYLTEIHEKVNSPQASLELFTLGEPPSSTKMNKFVNAIRDDINVSAKQLDFLNAKAISIFNLFSSEIENEKKYTERIFSKTKILQMYSSSPSNDIVYNGDSFENGDYIDWANTPVSQNPMIAGGFASVKIKDNPVRWQPNEIIINPSNGFIGDNNLAVKKTNNISDINYEYKFLNPPSTSNAVHMADLNPASFFVYEAISVEPKDNVFRHQNEFCYIVDDTTLSTAAKNSLVNWSNHNMNDPLRLDFTLKSKSTQKANSITITPNFDSSKIVKVKNIYIKDSSGKEEDIFSGEYFIGLSVENLTKESVKNYSLNSATFRFTERTVSECRIVMEQPYYSDVEILHNYWTTNYQLQNQDNSPFYGTIRFNPELLNKDMYNKVNYNKSVIIPPLTNPNVFKKDASLNQNISITVQSLSGNVGSKLKEETFSVPIKVNREVLPAKRMSIAISDVSLSYEQYENSAEIISKSYNYDLPVESVMLDIDSNYNEIANSGAYIEGYISFDSGKQWIQISPVQSGYSTNKTSNAYVPEVFSINQKVGNEFKLPGVQYVDYPKTTINKVAYNVPQQVKNICVRIKLIKGTGNIVPVVYSYKLAVKVKQI